MLCQRVKPRGDCRIPSANDGRVRLELWPLFHAQVKPGKLYGIVNWGFTFQGLDMGIGHLRLVCWVKDDVPKNRINEAPNLIQTGRTAAQNR